MSDDEKPGGKAPEGGAPERRPDAPPASRLGRLARPGALAADVLVVHRDEEGGALLLVHDRRSWHGHPPATTRGRITNSWIASNTACATMQGTTSARRSNTRPSTTDTVNTPTSMNGMP